MAFPPSATRKPQGGSENETLKYPAGVPDKFDVDGHVQPFPGNTIICHLSPASPLYASLQVLYTKLAGHPLSHLYTLLPPASWHMTVFEGVCDLVRDKPGHWPSDLATDAPLAGCNALFTTKLKTFDLQCPPPYKMAVTGFEPLDVGIGVHVEPGDAAQDSALRGLRDRLAGLLGLRHAQHGTYALHISMTYLLRHLTAPQKEELRAFLYAHFESMPKEFELGLPEFCLFEDMFEFKRVLYLQDQKG